MGGGRGEGRGGITRIHCLLQLQPLHPRRIGPSHPSSDQGEGACLRYLGQSPRALFLGGIPWLLLAIAQCWPGVWNAGFGDSLGEPNAGKPGTPGVAKWKWAILELWDLWQTGGGSNMDWGEPRVPWVPWNSEWGPGRGGSPTAQRGTELPEV